MDLLLNSIKLFRNNWFQFFLCIWNIWKKWNPPTLHYEATITLILSPTPLQNKRTTELYLIDEHRSQNTTNPTTHQKDHLSGQKNLFLSTGMVQHTPVNKSINSYWNLKNKNHTFISGDTENVWNNAASVYEKDQKQIGYMRNISEYNSDNA